MLPCDIKSHSVSSPYYTFEEDPRFFLNQLNSVKVTSARRTWQWHLHDRTEAAVGVAREGLNLRAASVAVEALPYKRLAVEPPRRCGGTKTRHGVVSRNLVNTQGGKLKIVGDREENKQA